MSSPYEGNNPYVPPTQYPPSGYPTDQPSQYPPAGYPVDQPPQYAAYPQPTPPPVYGAPQYVGVPVVPVVAVNEPGSTAALVGMILGIIGIFFTITSIPGLIVSIFGLKSTTRKGMAIAGVITSIIGIVEIVVAVVFIVALFSAAASASNSYYQYLTPTP